MLTDKDNELDVLRSLLKEKDKMLEEKDEIIKTLCGLQFFKWSFQTSPFFNNAILLVYRVICNLFSILSF